MSHRLSARVSLVIVAGLGLLLLLLQPAGPIASEVPQPAAEAPARGGVGALGRIQPKDGVRRVAGPSEMALVLAELLVDVGDPVKANQVIARLDDFPLKQSIVARLESSLLAQQATIARMKATLAAAELDARRNDELFGQGVVAPAQQDKAKMDVAVARAQLENEQAQLEVAKASLRQAQMDLERRSIRSPIDGQVLRVHARAGEKVGSDGIVELGETRAMYAVAEVYETDIAHVKLGQRARIRSSVLPRELAGVVERIAMTVGKKRVFDDEPASQRDARVIEVEVKLLDSRAAAPFTNLQVEVRFVPDGRP